MAWPLASQFSAMLQRPSVAFRDPMLRQYAIERDRFRQPRPWAGSFAVVYKGIPPDGAKPLAIRVFTTESPERRERYDAISDYLKSRRPSSLVEFEYRDESIRAAGHGGWFPLLVMDWVEGETLFQWVRGRCSEWNTRALAAAAARWLDVVAELEDTQIAHGDLQHANVMVTPEGRLMLVDYDGMCVPALVGRRNLEVGIEPYQHPDRNPATLLSLDLDRFSAMVIYVALRALAADPGLWQRHVEALHYDKLLLRREDFQAPGSSRLVAELTGSPDPEVRDLTESLLELLRVRMSEVAPLRQLAHPSFRRIERLLVAEEWESAVELLNRRGRFRDAPPHLKPLIARAYEHVCRQQSWADFQKVPREIGEASDRRLVKAWNEAVFAGFPPAEQERPRVEAARQRVAAVDRLRQLAGQSPGGVSPSEESALVAAAGPLPDGYRHGLEDRVARARDRLAAVEGLRAAVEQSASEAAIGSAWERLAAVGCESLAEPAWLERIALTQRRLPLVEALRAIPPDLPADQLDRRLLEVWNEDLLADCADVEAWRPTYREAVGRRELLRRMAVAVARRDDAEVARLIEEPSLAGYRFPSAWGPAIQSARSRSARAETLLAALGQNDRAAFVRHFDARLVRQYRDRFARREALLCRWTELDVLPLETIGLGPAVARASLVCVDKAMGVYRVRWTWPLERFSEECTLAVCGQVPGPGSDLRQWAALHRVRITHSGWERGGGSRLVYAEPAWRGAYCVVWATVDLGFRVLASHPLVLGQVEHVPRERSGGWKLWHLISSRRGTTSPAPLHSKEVLAGQEDKGDRG
jgi:hypothetical protein